MYYGMTNQQPLHGVEIPVLFTPNAVIALWNRLVTMNERSPSRAKEEKFGMVGFHGFPLAALGE
jgi:hypothetical protein